MQANQSEREERRKTLEIKIKKLVQKIIEDQKVDDLKLTDMKQEEEAKRRENLVNQLLHEINEVKNRMKKM